MRKKRMVRVFLWLVMLVFLGVANFSLAAGIGCHRLKEYQLHGEDLYLRLYSMAVEHAREIMRIYLSEGMKQVERYAADENVYYMIKKTSGRPLGGNYKDKDIQQMQKYNDQVLQYSFWFSEKSPEDFDLSYMEEAQADYKVQIAWLDEEQVKIDQNHVDGLPDNLQYWINGFYVSGGTAFAVALIVFVCLLRGGIAACEERKSGAGKRFKTPVYKLLWWCVAAVLVCIWGRAQPSIWRMPITWEDGATKMLDLMGQCIRRTALWYFLLSVLLTGFVLQLFPCMNIQPRKRIGWPGRMTQSVKRVWNGLSWVMKVLIVLIFFCVLEAIGIGLAINGISNQQVLLDWLHDQGSWIVWGLWGLEKLALMILALRVADNTMRLRISGKELASGNLGYQIPLEGMTGELLQFAQDMNAISNVVADAVEDRIKGEHLKTELITNVSHDIKTPLTSIINYADLIGRQPLDNDKITEYAQVLYRQSSRLKKLIEDLMEVSKASTGNLEVFLERCQAGVILSQAMGEFEQRLQEKGIDMIVRQCEEPVWIMADPRMLWRILDNLMTNICKYAQNDTRVYLLLERQGERAVLTFKNISNHPLEIDAAELMERFVRGDRSRHTEGNGLGLAIARSLTELQGGEMQLVTDGDLFKVILTFPVAREEELETALTPI